MFKKNCKLFLMALLILISSVFYFGGVKWGLPSLLHPDEYTIIIPAYNLSIKKSFEPAVFLRPDHLLIQINTIAQRLYSFLNKSDLTSFNQNNNHYYIGRCITSLFTIGSIILMYILGRKKNFRTGFITAFIFAFFPLTIEHSHYVTPDIPTGFFMILFIILAHNYLRKPNYLNLTYMCLATSAFITIKYTGAILCVLIAVTVIVSSIINKNYLNIIKQGITAIFLVFLFIFLISPTLIINYPAVFNALANEVNAYRIGAINFSYFKSIFFYFKTYINYSGILLFSTSILGILYILKNWSYKELPFFYSLVYLFLLSISDLNWERWAIPMYPSLILLSAYGINSVFEFVKIKFSEQTKIPKVILSFLLVISISNLLLLSISKLMEHKITDTRISMQTKLYKLGITPSNSYSDAYSPFINNLDDNNKNSMDAYFNTDYKVYVDNDNINYLILSERVYSRFENELLKINELKNKNKKQYERYISKYNKNYLSVKFHSEIYKNIFDNYELVTEEIAVDPISNSMIEVINIPRTLSYINKLRTGLTGPDIKVYKIPEDAKIFSAE